MRKEDFVHQCVVAAIGANGFYQVEQRGDLADEALKVADEVNARAPFDGGSPSLDGAKLDAYAMIRELDARLTFLLTAARRVVREIPEGELSTPQQEAIRVLNAAAQRFR